MQRSIRDNYREPLETKTFVELPHKLDDVVNKWLASNRIGPRDFTYKDGTKVDKVGQEQIDKIIKEEHDIFDKADADGKFWPGEQRREAFKNIRIEVNRRVKEELCDELKSGMVREISIADTKLDTTYVEGIGLQVVYVVLYRKGVIRPFTKDDMRMRTSDTVVDGVSYGVGASPFNPMGRVIGSGDARQYVLNDYERDTELNSGGLKSSY
jgi:hypothetical protein